MDLTRRIFLISTSVLAGDLVVGIHLGPNPARADSSDAFAPNAFIRVPSTGPVMFMLPSTEMGQGVMTALAQIVAEELDLDPEALDVQLAPAHRDYNNPAFNIQLTGGSTSIAAHYLPLRRAAAATRAVLVEAAARRWQIPVASCITESGKVFKTDRSVSLAYSELAREAALITPPKEPPLKPEKDFRVIGQSTARLDLEAKTTGAPVFGIDFETPGMRVATVIHSPVFGGTVGQIDDTATRTLAGGIAVFEISTGVAVIGDRYWQVKAAVDVLKITWRPPAAPSVSSTDITAAQKTMIETASGKVMTDKGDAVEVIGKSKAVLRSVYEVPYMAHATMEPMNCAAHVTKDRCTVWTSSQSPGVAKQLAMNLTGFSDNAVDVHTLFAGGGFGRRSYNDFVVEAIEISKKIEMPVKVIWTREEDIGHDFYRPAAYHSIEGALDDSGAVSAVRHKVASQSILAQDLPTWIPAMLPPWIPRGMSRGLGKLVGQAVRWFGKDEIAVEGAHKVCYDFPHHHVTYFMYQNSVPVGFWRSVGHSYTGFVIESFIDEMAAAAKADPVEFRLRMLEKSPRHHQVLKTVVDLCAWPAGPPAGRFRGVALHESFASFCAQVIEISYTGGRLKIEKIWCAVDCGRVINPAIVRAQMESGIVFGLSAALGGKITIKAGAVEQSNFHNYPVPRITDCPPIEVAIVSSEADPTGVGEPGVPPVAPALANAIFSATGKRLRTLPLMIS